MGDDGARDHAGDGRVHDLGHRRLAHLAEVLAHAVEDHDRLVHRVAEDREHRREHRERELPLEEREEAENDHDVVQVRDDRRQREAPLEAEGEVDDDAEADEEQRQRPVGRELLADLAADELHTIELRGAVDRLQRRHDRVGLFLHLDVLALAFLDLERKAHQHVARGAERLHRDVGEAHALQGLADFLRIRIGGVAHLHHGAAGEFDGKVQSLEKEEADREQEHHERDDVEHQRVAHERDAAADAEEFHVSPVIGSPPSRGWPLYEAATFSLRCQSTLPMASFGTFFLPP